MNKEELIREVSKKTNYSQRKINDILNCAIDSITNSVAAGKKVTLVNFGVFEPKKRAAREARNPVTGNVIKVPEKTIPTFSAGKKFKEMVNK